LEPEISLLEDFAVRFIRPQNILDRARIRVIGHNDAHFVSRLRRLVLGKVFRRKRRPLVDVNLWSGDDEHKLSLPVEKAGQIPQDTQLDIAARDVVVLEGT
jgi:hypothetical protein